MRTSDPDFTRLVRRGGAVLGAAHNRPIGKATTPARSLVERLSPADRALAAERARHGEYKVPTAAATPRDLLPGAEGTPTAPEPLGGRQWNMR